MQTLLIGAAVGHYAGGYHAHSREQAMHTFARRHAILASGVDRAVEGQRPVHSAAVPVIAPVWSAKVNQTTWENGVVEVSVINMEQLLMVVDRPNKRLATRASTKFKWAPAAMVGTPLEWVNFSEFVTEDYMGIEINGDSLDASVYHNSFRDPFSWLSFAKDGGMKVFEGKTCHAWVLDLPTTKIELLVRNDSVPVYMSQNISSVPGIGNYSTRAWYHEWRTDASHLPDIWNNFSEERFKHPVACPVPADPSAIARRVGSKPTFPQPCSPTLSPEDTLR